MSKTEIFIKITARDTHEIDFFLLREKNKATRAREQFFLYLFNFIQTFKKKNIVNRYLNKKNRERIIIGQLEEHKNSMSYYGKSPKSIIILHFTIRFIREWTCVL